MTARPASPVVLHLVPHTHWDREWYEPFQRFRLRLVDLVDGVLDRAEADRRFRFTFDGQTAMLEDYLEIRPEAEPRIEALVATGQLAVGPWRILSDEFLVSGETLVRNLEAGVARAERFGQAMAVGYLPDEFGHAAQIPQLLRLAGFGHAAVWRGVPAAVDRHAFHWSAPDGSTVRAEYLVGGYGNAAGLFAYPDVAAAGRRLLERLAPFFGADPVLAMYGTDHATPLPELLEVVEEINRAQDGYQVRLATLAGYVLDQARTDGEELPRWQGELRSGARANILMGVLSARVGLKAACARAERLLARYAEPLQALHGTGWPEPFLELGWRRLVESSGHDSITGCGADAVADHVAVRLGEAAQLGSGLAERVAAEVAGRVPRGAVAVLNPSPFARAGLIDLDLVVPGDWDEVALELADGRLAATQEVGRSPALVHSETLAGRRLAELFRRVHGRELYDRVINRIRVELDGGHRLVVEVDDHPDPPHLDMDELRTEVETAAAAAPEADWEVRVVAPPRRRLLAAVPVPALGWTAVAAARAGDRSCLRPSRSSPGRGRSATGWCRWRSTRTGPCGWRPGRSCSTGSGGWSTGATPATCTTTRRPSATWWSPSPSGWRWWRSPAGRSGGSWPCAGPTGGRPASTRPGPAAPASGPPWPRSCMPSCGPGSRSCGCGSWSTTHAATTGCGCTCRWPARRSGPSPRASSRWSSGAPRPRAGTARCRCPPSRPAGSSTPAGSRCSWTR